MDRIVGKNDKNFFRRNAAIDLSPFSLRNRVLKDGDIGFLCPNYEGFLSLRKEYFVDAQMDIDEQDADNSSM